MKNKEPNKEYDILHKRFLLLQKDNKRTELRLREAKREIQRLEFFVEVLKRGK